MLTRIPCADNSASAQLTENHFKQCWPFFPFVGFIIGLCSAAVLFISTLFLPALPAAIITVIVSCLMTGAIHEDGFADACDGLFSGKPAEQAFAIMKDSRLGTYGVLGLTFNLLLKISLITSLAQYAVFHACFALVLSHCFARFSPLYIMYQLSPTESNQSKLSNNLSQPNLSQLATLLSTIITALFLLMYLAQLIFQLNQSISSFSISLFISAALTVVSAGLCSRYFEKKLQSYNGDCLGFTEQCSEILVLIGLSLYCL